MWKKTLLSLAAAAVIGTVGLSGGPASATPLAAASQAAKQAGGSEVMLVGYSKKRAHRRHHYRQRHHHRHHHRYSHRHRPSFSLSFGLLPGFYYGSYYHPRFYHHARAPYHCHRWSRYGHRNKRCHRHW